MQIFDITIHGIRRCPSPKKQYFTQFRRTIFRGKITLQSICYMRYFYTFQRVVNERRTLKCFFKKSFQIEKKLPGNGSLYLLYIGYMISSVLYSLYPPEIFFLFFSMFFIIENFSFLARPSISIYKIIENQRKQMKQSYLEKSYVFFLTCIFLFVYDNSGPFLYVRVLIIDQIRCP